MKKEYRIILQIKAGKDFSFRLWDKSLKSFTGVPKESTRLSRKEVLEHEALAEKLAFELFSVSRASYKIRVEPMPNKFELIEPKIS